MAVVQLIEVLIIILWHCVVVLGANTTNQCSTWYYPAQDDNNKCVCGSSVGGVVHCLSNNEVSVMAGVCMTYSY